MGGQQRVNEKDTLGGTHWGTSCGVKGKEESWDLVGVWLEYQVKISATY